MLWSFIYILTQRSMSIAAAERATKPCVAGSGIVVTSTQSFDCFSFSIFLQLIGALFVFPFVNPWVVGFFLELFYFFAKTLHQSLEFRMISQINGFIRVGL